MSALLSSPGACPGGSPVLLPEDAPALAAEDVPEALPPAILLVIPVYNHGETLAAVVRKALAVHPHVLVVDDGSSLPVAPLLQGLPCFLTSHPVNRGKGVAIRTAAAWAADKGYTHILTLDADGQHDPAHAHAFTPLWREDPGAVIVGARDFSGQNIPAASRFGRSFSGFWMRVQTGRYVSDMQSGFRLYPVALLQTVTCGEDRFAFEVEILVRAAWAGFSVREVAVGVFYPPPGERISHFRALHDNFRLSVLNTRLTMRSMLPVPSRQYAVDAQGKVSLVHPLRSLRLLLASSETPQNLGLAAALGMGIATLPLIGLHTIGVLFCCGYFRLNKLCALAVSQLGMPPFVPALAVELGHYCLHQEWLTEFSWQTLGYEAPQRLGEWVLGSVLLAPVLAMLLGLLVFLPAKALQKGLAGTRAPQEHSPLVAEEKNPEFSATGR